MLPLETICLGNCSPRSQGALVLQPLYNPRPLLNSQERCGIRKVVDKKVSRNSNKNCYNSFQDKTAAEPISTANENEQIARYSHPSPSLQPPNSIHFRNAERQQARECSRDASSREKQGLSQLPFMSTIPHSDIVCYARIQSSLCHTKEDACD